MRLIVGLGNPGKQYDHTWHNLGFLAVEAAAKAWDAPDFRLKRAWDAKFSQVRVDGADAILLQPQTFMNLSGQAVRAVAAFYKLSPENIWVMHDEIDLPLGTIRISRNASAAGHNGVQSIIDELGTKNFVRFRMGCATPKLGKIPTEDYVLQTIPKKYATEVKVTIKRTVEAVSLAATAGIDAAMSHSNGAPTD